MTVIRHYAAHQIVSLPSVDAKEAMAFGTAVLAVAHEVMRGGGAPDLIAEAIRKMEGASTALGASLDGRLPPTEPVSALGLREADHGEDAAWGGLYRFLQPIAHLPERFPQQAIAARILGIVFPDGLRFVTLPSPKEWTEAESRRQRMTKDGLDAQIEKLGGGPFIAWLKSAHAAYGVALGITEEKAADPQQPTMRSRRDELLDAVRSYVLKVSAFADSDDTALRALSERLLRPIVEWEQRHRARAAKSSGDAASAPGEAAAGGDPQQP